MGFATRATTSHMAVVRSRVIRALTGTSEWADLQAQGHLVFGKRVPRPAAEAHVGLCNSIIR